MDELAERFSKGAPSLKHCSRLQVFGDVSFGENVVCNGEVVIRNMKDTQQHIDDGSTLEGEYVFE